MIGFKGGLSEDSELGCDLHSLSRDPGADTLSAELVE
jgi:hypothetical protein